MPEQSKILHGGCFDCDNENVPILFSVATTRTFAYNPKKPATAYYGGFALCPPCARKELNKQGRSEPLSAFV